MRAGLPSFVLLALGCTAIFAGCGGERKTQPSPEPPAAPITAPTPAGSDETGDVPLHAGAVTAQVRVTDLQGTPLANMIPIVTSQPNAFDEPAAMGSPTDATGEASLGFPGGKVYYLRAWDPKLEYFPNNYYTVSAEGGELGESLTVVMVAAASLTAQLFMPDGQPAAEAEAGVMLIHPTEGPWWPARGQTGAQGEVHFAPLPPGKYVLRIRTGTRYQIEVGETLLQPGGEASLGMLTLLPLAAGH